MNFKTKDLAVAEEQIIEDNERCFKVFVVLPKVTTIFLAVVFFLLGIILAIAAEDAIHLLIFWGGGIIYCVLNYIVLKLVLSYKILHIYYLKKLSLNSDTTSNIDKETQTDGLPEI